MKKSKNPHGKRSSQYFLAMALCAMSSTAVFAAGAELSPTPSALQQQKTTVQGFVMDDQGAPLESAIVTVPSQGLHTMTDAQGRFTLTLKRFPATVHISYVGYASKDVVVRSASDRLEVQLTNQSLDEVVVVGFGTQKKVNLTGAVATMDAKEIAARPVNSVVDALQGAVPGMNITAGSSGGQLNSNRKFNIRGTGTIGAGSSVAPLVLIDGMDGDINTINPQDIENISVLKDAAASSIYGSRAAGGVILVTTKRGKEGKTTVSYNNSFRFNSPLNMPKKANSYEYALYFNTAGHSAMFSEAKLKQIQATINGSKDPTMFANNKGRWEIWDDLSLLPTANTDWLDTHFGNSHSQEHNISVNGGTSKTKYYLSANYLGQKGMLKQADDTHDRYNVMARINTEINAWAKLNYTARFERTDYEAPVYLDGLFYHNMVRYWPIIPVTDPNGHYVEASKISQLKNGGLNTNKVDRFTQQLALNLTPLKGWNINLELNYRTSDRFQHQDWQTVYGYDVKQNPFAIDHQTSSVKEFGHKSNFFNPNLYTTYEFALSDHNFKVMAGYQSEMMRNNSFFAKQDGILSGVPTLNTTATNAKVGGGPAEWTTAGFFGRLNYDYKGRYLVEANLRYDGSSRFIRDKRWNWFPSFSFGWNVAREAFFQPIEDKVNNLKLRFSWGQLGNQNTDSWYPFYSTMGYESNAGKWLVGNDKPNIASQPQLVSALLTWEKTRTWNVGFDLGSFNNRLNVSFDYFQRRTYDMVGPAPELPDVLGAAVPKVNNLDMTSMGWELAVRWRDNVGEFRYGAALSLSDNQVVIDKYPNQGRDLKQVYYEGAHLGDIWGYETIGIAKTDQEMNDHLAKTKQNSLGANWAAGDIMYRDLNGDGKVDAGENTEGKPGDRRIIGNSTPRYNIGLNLDAAWRGFDLKIFFQGVLKRDYWASGSAFWGASGGKWQSAAFKEHMDYFRADPSDPMGQNLDAYYPRPDWTTGKNQQVQTRYLQNAAYLRLKNVTLGYTLPAHVAQSLSCSNLRVFLSAENFLTFTSFTKTSDPELIDATDAWGFGKMYPLSKTISCGLSVTF